MLGRHEAGAPSYLPFLLILLVALAGLPVAHVASSSAQHGESPSLLTNATPVPSSHSVNASEQAIIRPIQQAVDVFRGLSASDALSSSAMPSTSYVTEPATNTTENTAPSTQPGSTGPATNATLFPGSSPSSRRYYVSATAKSQLVSPQQTAGSWAMAAELSPGSNVPTRINGVSIVAYLPSIPSGLIGPTYWYSEVFTLFFPNGVAFQLAISAYQCTGGQPCYAAQYDYDSIGAICTIDSAPFLGVGGALSGGRYWDLAVWWGGSTSQHWYYGIAYGNAAEGPFTIWQTGTLVSLQSILSSADQYSYVNAYADGTCSGTHVNQPFAAVESYDFSQSDWTTIGTIPFARAINYYTGTGSTNWPTMYWATGAVWIGSQSYNMMDLNGNYYDNYLGNNQAPSWVYVAGCLQGQPSACTTGSTGSYNKFSAGYSSSLGAYSSGSSTSLLWALPPAASWSFIYAQLSQSLTFSYVVTNPNGFDMYLGLGAYVRQTSNPSTIYIDPSHDTVVRASQCVSSCSRTFGLSGLSPGSYDVGAALWSGQPNQSPFVALWGINWQNDALTISSPTVTVTVYSIDLQFKGQDPALQSDLHGSISNSYQGSASTTAYSFQLPVNTQLTFSVSSSPSGWSFANWWDDYGYGQGNTPSFTINVGTGNHKVVAFFTYSATFQQSGIPPGITWGITVGGTRRTSTGSSVTVSGLGGTVNYSYDSTVPGASGVQYVCTSGCSGSVSGSATVTANYATLVTMTVSYSVIGDGTSYSVPIFNYVQAGISKQYTLTTSPTAVTVDVGSSWSVTPNPLSGSGSLERWITTQTTSGTISSAQTIAFTYQHQYYLTTQVSPPSGGTVTVSSGWQNAGITVPVTATPNTDYAFYYWSLDGTNVGNNPSLSVAMNSAHALAAFFLGSSAISLGVSSGSIDLGSLVILSGAITPTQPAGMTVSLSYSLDGSTWNTFIMTRTDGSGAYSVPWCPPYPNAYQIRASWSGNANYAGSTSSASSLSVTGTPPPKVTLLVTGPPSVIRGSTASFDVLVTNSGESLTTTLYTEVTGSGGYEYFDSLQVSVAAGSMGRFQFTWQAPSASGSYQVVVGLIPPRPACISQTQITIT